MECVACGGPTTTVAYGTLAPFIVALSGSSDSSTLESCSACGLAAFSHRYSDAELAAIYSGYRDPSYASTRKRWEPWYRDSVNAAFEDNSPAVRERIDFMNVVIAHSSRPLFALAVDFGGDEGQFFPDGCTERRVIIDVSDKPLPTGIERLASFADLGDRPDLVLICHVLEHLNDPGAVLRETRAAMDPAGFLYVEVPLDMPRPHKWHKRTVYRDYIARLSGTRWPLIASDFVTGVARQFGLRIPRLGLVKQSEHINYFTEQSLSLLLARCGFKVCFASSDPHATMGGLRLGKLGILAQPA